MIFRCCSSMRFPKHIALLALLLPVTARASLVVFKESSSTTAFPSTSWASQVSTTDLINSGSATFSNAVVGAAHGSFPAAGLNDGVSTNAVPGGNTFFVSFPDSSGTTSATFHLNVSSNTLGYTITSIQSFMGWLGTSSQAQANQTYTVAVRTVGNATYTDIATVTYLPFTDIQGTNHESHVVLTENTTGILASGVDSIRFTFLNPLSSVTSGPGTSDGTVVRELDVHGYPTGGTPPPPASPDVSTVTKPLTRQVFQRDATNVGEVKIAGYYTGNPSTIEARMVAMTGAGDTGSSTPWQEIVSKPTGGTYNGTLTGVPAGGWYQLEVRSVTDGIKGTSIIVPKIGIGDIYVTCGQSNSANHGSPAQTTVDDHVSAWNYSNGAWTKATDPMPGATGSGGSAWTRLGDLLVARNQVPVAFACLGVGGTSLSQWQPPGGNYARITAAMTAFPAHGFRAILWHQGESDSLASTSAASYDTQMKAIIAKSRVDAGWSVPWYVAEVSFHPSSTLAQEEPVVAGQRAVIQGDALVYPGPVTDDFHLEAKLSDSVHFNAAGLANHAAQWDAVLARNAPLTPKNGDFESNTALADGASAAVNTTVGSSPSVIGWRGLSSTGTTVADGSFGYANPGNSWYPGTADTSGGVIEGMSGRHIAFLSGSSADAQFLQTRRVMAQGGTTYTLKAALGVRATAETFGGAQLELLMDGTVLKSMTITRTDLDSKHAGNAAGTFTEVSLVATTPTNLVVEGPLAIRIRKTGGAATYLDFDNVRLESKATPYASWQMDNWGDAMATAAAWQADPDGDGLANGIEYQLHLNPRVKDASSFLSAITREGENWMQYRIPLSTPLINAPLGLWYSFDLVTWFPSTNASGDTIIESRAADAWSLQASVEAHPKIFFQISAGSPVD